MPVPLPLLDPPAPDEFAPEAPPPGVCAGLSASAAVPRAAMPAATAAALAAFLATCATFDVRVLRAAPRAAVFFATPRAAFFLPAPPAADLFAVFFDRVLARVLAAADFDFDLAPPRFALRRPADDFAFFLAVFAM